MLRSRFGVLLLLWALCWPMTATSQSKISFWDAPQYGANSFNETPPNCAYFVALRNTGATWVRLTFTKWKGEQADFLIGDVNAYKGLVQADLKVLKGVVACAAQADLKVVLVPLSLPGSQWTQLNGNKYDPRLWQDKQFWAQSAAFWRDMAMAFKDDPTVVAYNLINEPVPEFKAGLEEHAPVSLRQAWYQKNEGSSRDILAFYEYVTAEIRAVDKETPIMLDGGWYAGALGFTYWPRPLSDTKTLYAFHMYEPWAATSSANAKRKDPYRYPGVELEYGGQKVTWNKAMVTTHMHTYFDWADRMGIPKNRQVMGEFGCLRLWVDCGTYLNDVLDVANEKGVHWAFYSFRESWDGMDYEIAPEVTTGQFYYLKSQGKEDQIKRTPHPLLDIITSHMKR